MRPFAEVAETRWSWKRPRLFTRRHELMAGEDTLAVLEARSLLRSAMLGTTAGGQWRLDHVGLLRGQVRVTPMDAGQPAAEPVVTFRPRWFGAGDVTTAGGQSLRWHRADFWGRRWGFVDSGALTRIAYERAPGLLRADTHVLVSDSARGDPELEPLVLLGFYLLLLMARQSHAAT